MGKSSVQDTCSLHPPLVLEILAYKHHKEQVKVHDTDDRIVLGYLYVVNAPANRRAWTIYM